MDYFQIPLIRNIAIGAGISAAVAILGVIYVIMRKRRKSTVKVTRKRIPLTRRALIGTLAAGAGALAVGGAMRADEGIPESQLPQWVSWDDGSAYPVHDIDAEGRWIVKFDDGFFAVDPAGFVCDSGVWYAVTGWDPVDGFWFAGDDDYEYALVSDVILETIDPGPDLI